MITLSGHQPVRKKPESLPLSMPGYFTATPQGKGELSLKNSFEGILFRGKNVSPKIP